MNKRNTSEKIKREQDPIPWRYCLLTLVCGLLLVVGFFWAARQHFSAMDLGMKNHELRRQKESLLADQRLLERNREVSQTPAEIKKVARKFGLQELTAESIEVISSVTEKIIPQKQTTVRTFVGKTSEVEKVNAENKAEKANVEKKKEEIKPKLAAEKSDKK